VRTLLATDLEHALVGATFAHGEASGLATLGAAGEVMGLIEGTEDALVCVGAGEVDHQEGAWVARRVLRSFAVGLVPVVLVLVVSAAFGDVERVIAHDWCIGGVGVEG
jgi:hypothetical protein